MVVGVDPPPPRAELDRCVREAGVAIFGEASVLEVDTGDDGGAVLVLLSTPEHADRVSDPTAAQVLEAEVTARLGRAGLRGRGVAAVSGGPPITDTARGRAVAESQVELLGQEVRASARYRSYRHLIAEMLERGAIRTLFQPILEADTGRVFAYEALSRGPSGHPLEGPEDLIRAATAAGFREEVEWEMRWLATVRARAVLGEPGDVLLFVNASPGALWIANSPRQHDWTHPQLWPFTHTVTEATEREPMANVPDLLNMRNAARDSGVQFALDDAGAGYSGLAALALLAPEFVKVDMGLVRDCDTDGTKQAVISALVHFVKRTGARLIAEGIETRGEFEMLRGLGVDLVQGFLFARPSENRPEIDTSYFGPTGTG